ncbi:MULTISPECIES: carbohydrate ABC transporter permease [Lysinibacillus]|uniref:carbohydrate ABC transporter permease n=1 Tax=Lysinibacillus TaxID=400634 RepID=UPI001C8B4D5F|nr:MULTISPECIES: sugar ABC transporter permease [Lysinibacillus]MBX8946946.1 sugar ABC transporter permease [Lysinibacillus sp. K60]WHP40253.1 sugar ABC transporter permease [Lysinibacillus boronitolerans]
MIREYTASSVRRRKSRVRWTIHLFPIPALIIYGLFVLYPIIAALSYSFFEWKGMARGDFIGFQNFVTLFTTEPYGSMFWNAFKHNVLYFVVQMIVMNGLAFFLAFIIYQKIKGAEFFKAAFFLPRLLSVIVVGFLWKLILNPNFGTLNVILEKLGLETLQKAWLGDPKTALIAIILVNCWFGLGFGVLIFLAGFQGIPSELVEAAKLDGAKGFTLLRTIYLPLMVPSIMIMGILTFIQSFEAFELVYAMQGSMGEPYYSTDTLAVFFYRLAFGSSTASGTTAIGLGSALATVLFLFILVCTTLFLRFANKRDVQM